MGRTLAGSLLGRRRAQVVGTAGRTMLEETWTPQGQEERLDGASFLSYTVNGYKGNGIVFSVIGSRLHLFAEAAPRVLDRATNRLAPVDARTRILEEPWPNGSSTELLARMEQDVSLAGNAFIVRVGDRLARLRPDRVELVTDLDGLGIKQLEGYMYNPDGIPNDRTVFFTPDEVAHYSPVPDPEATFRGMSWLTPVVREVNADIAMTTHKIAFFEHGATPNLLIKYQQKLAPETIRKLSARFDARHGGAENAWRTAVLDEGADLTVVGRDMGQASFATLQAAGENRITAAGGVPGIVVGLKEGLSAATYSNYQQAMRRFGDGTMRPLWRTAAHALAKFVDLEEGEELVLDASNVEALREGESARAETFRIKATTAGELIRSGYDPETVAEAVALGDLSVLKHTGGVPTALYPGGDEAQAQVGRPEAGSPAAAVSEAKAAGRRPAKDSPLAQGSKGDGLSG